MASRKKKPVPWEWLRKETERIEKRDARRAERARALKTAVQQLNLVPVDSAPMQAVTNETGQRLVRLVRRGGS